MFNRTCGSMLVVLLVAFAAPAQGGQFLADFATQHGSAPNWDVIGGFPNFNAVGRPSALGPILLTDRSLGGDNDVTLQITSSELSSIGMAAGNAGAPAGAMMVDGVSVPVTASGDYIFNNNSQGSILFEIKNLNAGLYNISVFEGRTNDATGERAKIWKGTLANEPALQNTGNYAGTFFTLTGLQINPGDSLFIRKIEENQGGISGFIVNQEFVPVPEPSSIVLWAMVGLGGAGIRLRRARQIRRAHRIAA